MNNALILSAQNAFPQLAYNVTYNQVANMLLTPGYVSAAGNMYQEGVRLSKRLAVKFSIGHGWAHTFMNGIELYAWDGMNLRVVAHRCYSNFWWCEEDIRAEVVSVVMSYLRTQSLIQGVYGIPDSEFRRMATELVNDTQKTTELIGSHSISGNVSLCLKG
jgi:hypothetical protein